MDDRTKGILNQIMMLRIEVWRVEAVVHQQINYDLDCTLAAGACWIWVPAWQS